MAERKRLSDILMNSERERLEAAWKTTKPADDFRPIPPGEYKCRIVDGSLFNAKKGTPGYKLAFEVIEGEHVGRKCWHDVWLSEPALPMARRDLGKIGVTSFDQLEGPLPPGIVITAKIIIRKGDNGEESNRVSRFDVIGIEPPERDPFHPRSVATGPPETTDEGGFDWATGEQGPAPSVNGTTTRGRTII